MTQVTPRAGELIFRSFEPRDTDGIIALIDGIFREYGDRACIEKCDADLADVAAYYVPGRFMVLADSSGTVLGTAAIVDDDERPGVFWLKRVYLHPSLRGTGSGERLLLWAIDTARSLGCMRMEFWSDVRFKRGHAFYAKHGFTQTDVVRTVDDGWEPYDEYFFFKEW